MIQNLCMECISNLVQIFNADIYVYICKFDTILRISDMYASIPELLLDIYYYNFIYNASKEDEKYCWICTKYAKIHDLPKVMNFCPTLKI